MKRRGVFFSRLNKSIKYKWSWFSYIHRRGIKAFTVIVSVLAVASALAFILIKAFDADEAVKTFFSEGLENVKLFFTVELGEYLNFIDGSLKTGQKVLLGLTAFYVIRMIIEIFRYDSELVFFWISLIFYTITMFIMVGLTKPYDRYFIAAGVWIVLAFILQIVTAVLMKNDNIILRACITVGLSALAVFIGYWFGLAIKHPYEMITVLVFAGLFFAQMDAIFDEMFSGSSTPVTDTLEDIVGTMTGDEVDFSDLADM